MFNTLTFPETMEEFIEQYKVVKGENLYCDGVEFIPVCRMKEWFERLQSQKGKMIDRQAAIEVASRECHEFRGIFSDIEHGLKELPFTDLSDYSDKLWKLAYERGRAEGQPRKGKWMSVKNYGGISYSQAYSQCDQCHGVTFFGATMHFCPNCGADMRNSTKPKSCFECEYSVDYDDDTVMCSEVKGIISISQNHDMIPTFCPKYVEQI